MPKNSLEKGESGVWTLTLNRPEIRNALSSEMIADLTNNLRAVQNAPEVKVLIITGAGSAFCAGGDVQEMVNRQGMFGGTSIEIYNQYRNEIQNMVKLLHRLSIPTIAAVNGPAIGAGCDLAAFCDLRIGSNHAVFAESFVHLGLLSGDGGNWILPRVIGLTRACEMALMGDPVPAEKALQIGLITTLTTADDLISQAKAIGEKIARLSSAAIKMTKKLLHQSLQSTLDASLDEAAAMQALLHGTDEHREAIKNLLSHIHKK